MSRHPRLALRRPRTRTPSTSRRRVTLPSWLSWTSWRRSLRLRREARQAARAHRLAMALLPLLAAEVEASNRLLLDRLDRLLLLAESPLEHPLLVELRELQVETLNSLQPPPEQELSRLLGLSPRPS